MIGIDLDMGGNCRSLMTGKQMTRAYSLPWRTNRPLDNNWIQLAILPSCQFVLFKSRVPEYEKYEKTNEKLQCSQDANGCGWWYWSFSGQHREYQLWPGQRLRCPQLLMHQGHTCFLGKSAHHPNIISTIPWILVYCPSQFCCRILWINISLSKKWDVFWFVSLSHTWWQYMFYMYFQFSSLWPLCRIYTLTFLLETPGPYSSNEDAGSGGDVFAHVTWRVVKWPTTSWFGGEKKSNKLSQTK